jgi:hypothetical protein
MTFDLTPRWPSQRGDAGDKGIALTLEGDIPGFNSAPVRRHHAND